MCVDMASGSVCGIETLASDKICFFRVTRLFIYIYGRVLLMLWSVIYCYKKRAARYAAHQDRMIAVLVCPYVCYYDVIPNPGIWKIVKLSIQPFPGLYKISW